MSETSFQRNIASNTAIQIVGKLGGTILSLLAAGMIFRYLGGTGLGKYTTVLSLVQIFGTLMDLGLYVLLIKKLANPKEPETTIHALFTLRIVSGILFLGCAPLTAIIFSAFSPLYSPEIITGIVITTVFAFGISLNQLFSAIFQKNFASRWIAAGEFISKIGLVIGVVIARELDLGLLGILSALSIATIISTSILYYASRKFTRMRWHWNAKTMRSLLLEAWPVAVSVALVLLYFRGDVIVLSFFEKSQAPIGIYGAPYKILEVLVTFPAMFTGLMLTPIASAFRTHDNARVRMLFQQATNAIAILAFPIVAGLISAATPIMHMIAGRDFTSSGPILQILSLATGGIFFGTLFGYVVVAIDKQKAMMWAYGFIALSALILYIIVIPRWSIYGAAWVTVYSELSVALLAYRIVHSTLKFPLHWGVVAKAFFCAILMGLGVRWFWPLAFQALGQFEQQPLLHDSSTVALTVLFGIGLYTALLFGSGATSVREMKQLMSKK